MEKEKDTKDLTTDDKLDLLLARFSKFDDKLTSIGTRLETIEGTVGDHSASILRIDGNLVSDTNRLVNLETTQNTNKNDITELKKSAEFLSAEYEKMKLKISEFEVFKTENVQLKKRVDDLENELLQEKIGRNDDQQYQRQAKNAIVCGVQTRPGEDVHTKSATNPVTLEVLKQLCQQTDIHLPQSAIDVCHRLGPNDDAPIIIRFQSKSDRVNFVAQKEKLKNVTTESIDLSSVQVPKHIQEILNQRKTTGAGRAGPNASRGGYNNVARRHAKAESDKPSYIHLQDHLTQRNKELLKEAKVALQDSFKFPGYVMDGQIRAKRAENEKFTVIKCSADIKKLLSLKPVVPPKPR